MGVEASWRAHPQNYVRTGTVGSDAGHHVGQGLCHAGGHEELSKDAGKGGGGARGRGATPVTFPHPPVRCASTHQFLFVVERAGRCGGVFISTHHLDPVTVGFINVDDSEIRSDQQTDARALDDVAWSPSCCCKRHGHSAAKRAAAFPPGNYLLSIPGDGYAMWTSSRILDPCHAGSARGDFAARASVAVGGEALAAFAAQLLLG